MSDLIYREDAIEAIQNTYCKPCKEQGNDYNEAKCRACNFDDAILEIRDVPSAEAFSQSEQYKKGFEDAKRAFELEFAREAESIRKRNVELNVMLNVQKELSADAKWIPCSERLPKELKAVNVTWVNHNPAVYYQHIKDVPKANTAVYYKGMWYWWDATIIDLLGEYDGAYVHDIKPIDKDIEVTAWTPLPKPYKESEVEECG